MAADQTTTIETGLLAFTPEIDARLKEDSRALSGIPSLETLKTLETGWQRVSDNLTSWERDLTASASRLDKKINDLAEQAATWELTLELAKRSVGTPPEVLQRIETVIAATLQTRAAVERRRAQMLALQTRLVEQIARVSEALNSISQARDVAVNRLFVLDSPPIWSAEALSRVGQNLKVESHDSFSTQWTAFKAYAERRSGRFLLHIVVILVIVAALYRMRRKVRLWVEAENISMPYQQRDLRLRSIDPEALGAIAARGSRLSNDGPASDETMTSSGRRPKRSAKGLFTNL